MKVINMRHDSRRLRKEREKRLNRLHRIKLRRIQRRYTDYLRSHDIWIDFASLDKEEKTRKESLLIEEDPNYDYEAPPLPSALLGRTFHRFFRYGLIIKAFAYRNAWEQTYTYITFQRYWGNPLGGDQLLTPSFTSYVNRFDRTQGFLGSFPEWQFIVTLNHFHPILIRLWYAIHELILELRIAIRLTLMLLRFPSFKRIKRLRSRRKLTKRQFTLPRILRRVGGPAGYLQLIGMVVFPVLSIVLAWQTGYSISSLPLESLVKDHTTKPGLKISPLQSLIQASWQESQSQKNVHE